MINFLIPPEITVPVVEAAISELRRARPVIINCGDKSLLIMASEFAYQQALDDFMGMLNKPVYLVVAGNRAKAIFPGSDYRKPVKINIKEGVKQQDVFALIGLGGEFKKERPRILKTNEYEQIAINLLKLAELMPSVLVSKIGHGRADELSYLYGLVRIGIGNIVKYEQKFAISLTEACSAPLQLDCAGEAEIKVFRVMGSSREHYAIIVGKPEISEPLLVRIHSSCYTGDLLSSLRCDCRDQLHEALHYMSENGGGVLLYLMQEGRGIGLVNKLRAYSLQAKGMDTVEANEYLGFEDDERPYMLAAEMLKKLGIKKVKLLTNNPRKMRSLEEFGIKVADRVPLMTTPHEHNENYLGTKFAKLGHLK